MFTLRGLVIVDFTYDSTIKSSEELELVLIKSIKLFSTQNINRCSFEH